MPRAVILTALPVEYLAVRSHISDLREEMHPQGNVYERGKFTANGQEWEVGIVETGAGNAGAAVEAERAIAYFKPDILFFVGIAGGIKDVAIGDVVAATKVYGYESGKVGEQFSTRPAVGQSAYALVQRAKSEARKEEWLQRLTSNLAKQPRVFVAPIAAGEKVVSSSESELFKFLRASYSDAVAVEMEGFGFLSAAFAYPEIKAIIIRGISDLIEGKNDSSIEAEKDRQERASHHTSAFAFEILAKLGEELFHSPDLSQRLIDSPNLIQSAEIFPDLRGNLPHSNKSVLELSLAQEIDVSQLCSLLSTKKWKEADQETARLLLQLASKGDQDCLEVEDLQKISPTALQKINKWWDIYSHGKFGFIHQLKIWKDLGEALNHDTEKHLCNCIGWRRNDDWKDYSELNFSLERAPRGHLPGFFLSLWCWRSDQFWLLLLRRFGEYN